MSMMLSQRNGYSDHQCPYGCCTDYPPTGPNNRLRRRFIRKKEERRWRKDQDA